MKEPVYCSVQGPKCKDIATSNRVIDGKVVHFCSKCAPKLVANA